MYKRQAYTNVDKAETDYDLVNLLNNTAAGNLAQAMKEGLSKVCKVNNIIVP